MGPKCYRTLEGGILAHAGCRFPRFTHSRHSALVARAAAENPRRRLWGIGACPWSSCKRISKASMTFLAAFMARVDGGYMNLNDTTFRST